MSLRIFFLSIFFFIPIKKIVSQEISRISIDQTKNINTLANKLINVELDIGAPHIFGLGLEFFVSKKKPTISFFYNSGGKKILEKPFELISENYNFFDFSVNKVEYGFNIYLKNNFYASLSRSELELIFEYDNSEDIRLINHLRNSSPVLKIGFKHGIKFFIKTEIGYNFNFPEKIFGFGKVGDFDVLTAINSNKIPLVDNNGFFVATVKIGYGFL
tara:strand:- start:95 stop:742 length:648 start_codon:yes stop_codon:yes gene_type:complete